MKRVIIVVLMSICALNILGATITASTGTNEWTNTAAWVGGVIPVNGDIVIIPNGATVTITGQNVTYTGTLTINVENGGSLQINAQGCGFFCVNDASLEMGAGSFILIETGGVVESTTLGGAFADIVIDGSVVWDPLVLFGTSDPNPGNGPATISETGFMPVELLYLEANINQDIAEIDWATSFEENFSHFEIEHSIDKESYTVIGAVDGVGESIDIVEYSFQHTQPMIGTNYYRLNAIDIDGSQEYFGPLEVEYIGDPELLVYPNPVAGYQVNADLNFHPERPLRMTILDHSGKVILDLPISQAKNQVELPSNTASGLYLLMISDGSRRLTKRFVVE